MFLHIGNNVLVRKEDVIGIFSVPALINDPKGKKLYNDICQNKSTIDISEKKHSSIIMTVDAVYISRISTATLQGRSGSTTQEQLSAGVGGAAEEAV